MIEDIQKNQRPERALEYDSKRWYHMMKVDDLEVRKSYKGTVWEGE